MAFGVLPSRSPQPTGTTLLENVHHEDVSQGSEKPQLILVPQPSDSPRDPLNLSRVRKELLFATIVFGACLTGVIGPLLVPGFSIVAKAFNIGLTQVTLLNGSLVMALGVSSYLCTALAQAFGKRIIYLLTTIMLICTCCWAAAAQTYSSLLASRVFQGLAMGGFFALAGTSSINDVFFVHERGLRVGLWNFAVIVSVNITPIISGYVIVDLSWRWSFGILAITFGILLLCIACFFPETTFRRRSERSMSVSIHNTATAPSSEGIKTVGEKIKVGTDSNEIVDKDTGTIHSSPSILSRILGIADLEIEKRPQRVLGLCISPLLLLRHPAIIWGCLMWSVTFTWVIIQGAVADQIFEAPPYNLSPTSVGKLIGIAPLIGSALGTVLGGWSCDYISKAMAMRNKGVFEPEFRLLVIVPTLVTMVIGSFGLGAAVHNGLSAIVCGVFLAIINFSVGIGCTGIVAYTNDVCGRRAGEAFGLAMLVKSAFAFGLTFVLNTFYASSGAKVFFFTFGGLTTGIMLLTLPMYVYGKRVRAWCDKMNIV